MQTNNLVAGGQVPDLLSAIYGIEVKHEEKITEADRVYCQSQQEELYKTLDQLDRWYAVFTADAERFRETRKFSYKPNGRMDMGYYSRPYSENPTDYEAYAFEPFDSIDTLADLNGKAQREFARRIVGYFRRTYHVEVPDPDIDRNNLPMGARPVYTTYVDRVIEHLGGRSFRTTAEEELIARFHDVVHDVRNGVKPILTGNKITFHQVFYLDSFSLGYGDVQISYSKRGDVETFCAGIAFGADDTLSGGSGIVCGFDIYKSFDPARWYDLTLSHADSMKFYKNGRIDVKFPSRADAEACYLKLRLNEIRTQEED